MLAVAEDGFLKRLKKHLSDKLVEEGCFWSYDMKHIDAVPDDMLIYKALVHLDIDDLHLLFNVFPKNKIKKYGGNSSSYKGSAITE